MDCVSLLAEARAAGLTVTVEDGNLVVRGPRAASDVAGRLIAAKPAVLAALEGGGATGPGPLLPEADAWDRGMHAGFAPVVFLPPAGCLARRVCSRAGLCDRHRAGDPCHATETEGAR